MATGGSGDVLTGILAGLKAQGYTSLETCLLGVYLHGLAGDRTSESLGQEAMIAGDIVENLGIIKQDFIEFMNNKKIQIIIMLFLLMYSNVNIRNPHKYFYKYIFYNEIAMYKV